MQSAIDRYDLDAAADAFVVALKGGAEPGGFFKDSAGIRWKYLARMTELDQYIASHGEFGIVMTFDHLADGRTKIDTELKRLT
jgi:hypothetical protein